MSAAGDAGGRGDGQDDEGGEWRFGLEDVGPEAEAEEAESEPIEPESLDRENVVFFALGVLFAVLVFASLFL